ncbi:VOC family protein [Roseomonas gilardii]|uniref:VOC family protein n=1 Tax=Roseomonas gilardii TaxID=257708 RepID=A0ABU3MIQ0_9PROT|nr:VOC family protein [Roseomonas gilardii]MDT8332874.1 VOC family protein [Roseomonas gilardii]
MSMPHKPLVKSMNHTSYTVSDDDFDRLLDLFSKGLGFPITEKGPRDPENMEAVVGVPGADVIIAYVQAPGHKIELINYIKPDDKACPTIRPCDTGFAHIAFDVTDIDAALSTAESYGFKSIHEPLPVSAGPNVGNMCVYTRDKTGITIEYIGPRLT